MHLPNKNLKHYLNTKPKYWTWNMALEAQTANNYLHTADQDRFRWKAAKKSDRLCKCSLHKINQNSKNEKKKKIIN
jgi:ribosomal protein L4